MRDQSQMLQLLIRHDVRVGEVPHIDDVGVYDLIHPWESIVADFKVTDRSPMHAGEAVRNEPLAT